jgi:GNAT superfamily N-acetyltransferase
MYFSNKLSFFDLSNTWYIKCQGRLVAWVALSRETNGSVIQVLFVEKTWRKRGLASALVKRIIQEAHPPISLHCSHQLVNFYSRLGFVRHGSNILGFPCMVYKGLERR